MESSIAQLREQARELPARQAELSALQEQLPASVNMPRLVRDLDGYAVSAGVLLTEVTPSPATAVSVAGAEQNAATAGATGGATAGADGRGRERLRRDRAQRRPERAGHQHQLFAVPVQLALTGDYFSTAVFLKKIQNEMKRAFLITQVDISGEDEAGTVTMSLQGQVYVFQQIGGRAASIAPQPVVPTPSRR